VISARAFAPLALAGSIRTFFHKGDALAVAQGAVGGQELAELSGWQHMFHVEPSITDGEAGIIMGHLDATKTAMRRAHSPRI
jgi:16S rRNA (guanine527-N7)-methyltransferase